MIYFKKFALVFFLLIFLSGCSNVGSRNSEEDNIINKNEAGTGIISASGELSNLEEIQVEKTQIEEVKIEEIQKLITEGEDFQAETKYKEFIENHPNYLGIKEGYESFKKSIIGNIDDKVTSGLEEIQKLVTEGENLKVEEKYKELIEIYPNHLGLKEGYEAFKKSIIENIDNKISNDFEEINKLITEGENLKVEEKYKELMEMYPNHLGIKEGYEAFKDESNKTQVSN